jgi:hypothetical protein
MLEQGAKVNTKMINSSNGKFQHHIGKGGYLEVNESIKFINLDNNKLFVSSPIIGYKFVYNIITLYTLNSIYIFEVYDIFTLHYLQKPPCFLEVHEYVMSLKSKEFLYAKIDTQELTVIKFDNELTLRDIIHIKTGSLVPMLPYFGYDYILNFPIIEIDLVEYILCEHLKDTSFYPRITNHIKTYDICDITYIAVDDFKNYLVCY